MYQAFYQNLSLCAIIFKKDQETDSGAAICRLGGRGRQIGLHLILNVWGHQKTANKAYTLVLPYSLPRLFSSELSAPPPLCAVRLNPLVPVHKTRIDVVSGFGQHFLKMLLE